MEKYYLLCTDVKTCDKRILCQLCDGRFAWVHTGANEINRISCKFRCKRGAIDALELWLNKKIGMQPDHDEVISIENLPIPTPTDHEH